MLRQSFLRVSMPVTMEILFCAECIALLLVLFETNDVCGIAIATDVLCHFCSAI